MTISISLSRTLMFMSPSSLKSRSILTPSLALLPSPLRSGTASSLTSRSPTRTPALTLLPSRSSTLTCSRSAMPMPPPLSLSAGPYPLSIVSVLPPSTLSLSLRSVTAMASVSEGAGQGDQTLGSGGDANGGGTNDENRVVLKKDPWNNLLFLFRSLIPGVTGVLAWYSVAAAVAKLKNSLNLPDLEIHLSDGLKNLCKKHLTAIILSVVILCTVVWALLFSNAEDEARVKRVKTCLGIMETTKKIFDLFAKN